MRIKFLTLNIWMGKVLDNALEFIKTERPDILAVQEIFHSPDMDLEPRLRLFDFLKTELDYPYAAFSPTHIQEGVQRGNAVFSRYPLQLVDTIFFDVPYNETYEDIPGNFEWAPRNMQHVEVTVDKTKLNIFNLHGIWGPDGNDTDRRLKMSETIIDHIKDKENVILAGDSNVNPDTKTIGNIEKHLTNIFKDELTCTFNMKYKTEPGFATAVVDMILVSENLKVMSHSCPQVDVSDHLPLVCEIEV